jgi:hypothetical protein
VYEAVAVSERVTESDTALRMLRQHSAVGSKDVGLNTKTFKTWQQADGWRKEALRAGSLSNELRCDGTHEGALLYDVRDCSDIRKTESDISKSLSEVGAEVMGGEQNAAGFAGWVVDNTRSNHAAIRSLEETSPEWATWAAECMGLPSP